jgi:hypothetical protein
MANGVVLNPPNAVSVGSKYDVAVTVQPAGRFRGVDAVINDRLPTGAVMPVSVIRRYASPPEGLPAAEFPTSRNGAKTVELPMPAALVNTLPNVIPPMLPVPKVTPVSELPVTKEPGAASVVEIPISIVAALAVPTHEPTLAAINHAHTLAAFIG